MIVENSPVGSSKSNGTVERAIQSVQGMVRTLRISLEEHARGGTLHLAVECRTRRVLVDEIRSWARRKDSVREIERKIGA